MVTYYSLKRHGSGRIELNYVGSGGSGLRSGGSGGYGGGGVSREGGGGGYGGIYLEYGIVKYDHKWDNMEMFPKCMYRTIRVRLISRDDYTCGGSRWGPFEKKKVEHAFQGEDQEKSSVAGEEATHEGIAKDGGNYSHYAVRHGRVPGIYTNWEDAEPQVLGFPRAKFNGFRSLDEAIAFMHEGSTQKMKSPAATQKMKGPAATNVERLAPRFKNMDVGSSQFGSTSTAVWASSFCSEDAGTEEEFVPETQMGGFLVV
ncbi:hypothetical protein PIB30_030354 [Stylosanthes scabra]|uniref:Ribonuclease H1 N-terminal domain-containing protein n=1 Tax=Stylosanthes scabra TaxID=79078 RepID=A0ABU6VDN3_9FABA|nr:hypothetical protein [Stylosanthes scabra]